MTELKDSGDWWFAYFEGGTVLTAEDPPHSQRRTFSALCGFGDTERSALNELVAQCKVTCYALRSDLDAAEEQYRIALLAASAAKPAQKEQDDQ